MLIEIERFYQLLFIVTSIIYLDFISSKMSTNYDPKTIQK